MPSSESPKPKGLRQGQNSTMASQTERQQLPYLGVSDKSVIRYSPTGRPSTKFPDDSAPDTADDKDAHKIYIYILPASNDDQ